MTQATIAPWLDESRWPTVPIKLLAKLGTGHTPSRNVSEYWEDCTIPWITLADVWQLRGGNADIISETKEKISKVGLANSAAVKHPAGTVILSRTASVGFSGIMGTDMATSQDFATWTCGPSLYSRYLFHALRAMAPDLKRVAAGSTHKTIYMPDIEQLRIPVPPVKEQHRIADFLDAETDRIDRIARARRRQMELLADRLDTQWTVCVIETGKTHGWVPIRRFVEAITDGPFGSSLTSSHYSDDGARVVRLGNIGRASFKGTDAAFIPLTYFGDLRRHEVVAGDLIVAGLGDENHPLGRSCVAPDGLGPAIVKADCFRLRLDQSRVTHAYAAWVMSSPLVAEQIVMLARGSTRARINLSVVREVQIPVPPLAIQDGILHKLALARSELTTLNERCERQLALFAERRQALITAAVTGQIDVTTARGVDVS